MGPSIWASKCLNIGWTWHVHPLMGVSRSLSSSWALDDGWYTMKHHETSGFCSAFPGNAYYTETMWNSGPKNRMTHHILNNKQAGHSTEIFKDIGLKEICPLLCRLLDVKAHGNPGERTFQGAWTSDVSGTPCCSHFRPRILPSSHFPPSDHPKWPVVDDLPECIYQKC